MSTECSRRLVSGRASDAMSGSSRTLFWDPVRAVHVAACGLMSVQRKKELEVPIICARKVETTPVPDLNIYDDV